ncbi:SUMF1/EgtB/PvdO family nonheme iron enzyme [bacterium]|nr:SUMF1/EgtB/PvdO family nonheme iron enzyme [bacterium]
MVFDSRSKSGSQVHRSMVELLKEKRAEGHFAGLQMEQSIQVYDFAVPAHAAALARLGLTTAKAPCLCLVSLNSRGLPERVSWSSQYDRPDAAMLSLDQALGIQGRGAPKVPPILVVVGSSGTAPNEAEAKLRGLQEGAWKDVKINSLEVTDNLTGVPSPGLAMLDPQTRKVLWSKSLSSVDGALQSLSTQLGTVYAVPHQIKWPKDGSILLYVPAGLVTTGSNKHDNDSKPRHTYDLKEPYYYIARTELTVGQFRKFVDETHYKSDCEKTGRSFVFIDTKFRAVDGACWFRPDGKNTVTDDFPVTHISLNDANAYCLWAGLRLPDEREWENAAGSKEFPWGDEWNPSLCKQSVGHLGGSGLPTSVANFPGGASPVGALDMAGNVYEWTSSIYAPYPGSSHVDPRMNGLRHVIRGGSFGNDEISDYWVTKRTPVGSQDTTVAQGFRVCLGGPQSK